MSTSGILKVNKNGKYKYYYVSGDAFPEALKPEIRNAFKKGADSPDDLVKNMGYEYKGYDGNIKERISPITDSDAEEDLLNYEYGTDRLYDVL